MLFRSKVRPRLVQKAFEPLIAVAERGVPVVVVPGNHERSEIPFPLLAAHPDVHILHSPRTVRLELDRLPVAVARFPFERHRVRERFGELVATTGWNESPAAVRLLSLHQTVEGARVGPVGYTFRRGADVVRGRDLPAGFAAVLAGHIHRHQVLTRDLAGRDLAAPVLYPGSIERTSTAERDETKGYLTLEVAGDADGGKRRRSRFHPLPTRPMVDVELRPAGLGRSELEARLARRLAAIDPDAVVRLRVRGEGSPAARELLRAAAVRALAPETMTVSVHWLDRRRRRADTDAPGVG